MPPRKAAATSLVSYEADDIDRLEADASRVGAPGTYTTSPQRSSSSMEIASGHLTTSSQNDLTEARLDGEIDDETRHDIARIWGSATLADPIRMLAIVRVQRELDLQGVKILAAAVQIGRALRKLHDAIGFSELRRGMRDGRRLFRGWSAGNLSKMMAVAEFVDRFEPDYATLPQNWSVLYEFTTLSLPQLEHARRTDLLRPGVTRNQVQAFKMRIKSGGEAITTHEQSKGIKKSKLQVLHERLVILESQVRDVKSQISAIEG